MSKTRNYSNVIVYLKPCFQNVFFLTETQCRRFQVRPVWRAFSEKVRFRDGLEWTEGLPGENKAASSNFSGVGSMDATSKANQ